MTEPIKIYHKTDQSSDEKHYFSTLYLTIGTHIIGDVETVSMTKLLISEIEQMVSKAKMKKSTWRAEKNVNEALSAFPENNECFDGEKGFLAFTGKTDAILVFKDVETGNMLATIVNSDNYIELWQTVLNELKEATKNF